MTLYHPYVLTAMLVFFSFSIGHAITLYSQSSGTWGPSGTIGLFNDASNGTGTAYDGDVTSWQGSGVDIVIQSGHTIVFRHSSFTIGNLTIDIGCKLYTNDDNAFFNYILDIQGTSIIVNGKLGNGVPVDPDKADRIGIALNGGDITGSGELTIREMNWTLSSALKIVAKLNLHMYYIGTWYPYYLYTSPGLGNAPTLTISAGGQLNIYGSFAADFDLQSPYTSSTNTYDYLGKVTIEGTMTIQEGNLIMKNDNSSGQDFTIAINTGGSLILGNSILGNGGVGDPTPYAGAGKVLLNVTGTLESSATDPILYTSNRATVDMNNTGSRFILNGGTGQFLDDDVLGARYYDVELAGTGPKALEGSVSIDNALTFTSSGIELGNHDLTMTKVIPNGQTSDVFVTPGPTQFISTTGTGIVKAHVPRGGFFSPGYTTFPVGNGTYNALQIESYSLVADYLSVRVANQVLDAGTTGTPITSHVVNKTWFIEEDVVGGSNNNLTFMWSVVDQSTVFNQSKTYVSHYTNNAWDIDMQYTNGKAAASSGGFYTVSRNGVLSYSPFTVFSLPAVPLPVEWLSFRVKQQKEVILLEWKTAWEEDNKQFVIEHSSDGKNFAPIGIQKGKNNTSIEQTYQFLHTNPDQGLNYYRLKQEDFSGDFEYSDIESIFVSQAATNVKLEVYPNPVKDLLQIKFQQSPQEAAQLIIVNLMGQEVLQFNLIPGGPALDLSKLLPGQYVGLLQVASERSAFKFTKE
ncbi:MAG: T9SS type A sorting domain-containing protein [Saprospiraceae bacterium]